MHDQVKKATENGTLSIDVSQKINPISSPNIIIHLWTLAFQFPPLAEPRTSLSPLVPKPALPASLRAAL